MRIIVSSCSDMMIRLEFTVSTTPNLDLLDPGIHPLRAKLFHGFADPSRLAILEVLRTSPRSVGAIVEQTGLSQSNTSNHLSCLLDCGLVAREQQGKYAIYSLADDRIGELLALVDLLLGDFASQIAACVNYETARVN